MPESREQIKTRMLKSAARAWNLPDAEAESNFDPLVSMLLTACSVELEKISGEIESSRARVLEKMVQLLSPDAFTGALPAHAVATATPVEKRSEIAENQQLYLTKKIQAASENDDTERKDLFFTPSASFTLSRATVRFMAVGDELYRMTNGIIKEKIGQAEQGKELPACSLWLGIDEPGITLDNCSFYFDLRNEANKKLFYHQLPKADWYWDDRPIPHEYGYGSRMISGEQLDFKNILERDDDTSGKIKSRVNAFYKPFFITLNDKEQISTSEGNEILGNMIAETFAGRSAQLLKPSNLRWICIDFPQTISSAILKDVVCIMNSFPVFNRRAHDFTYRMQDIVNVIPLQTDDLFLDMEEVVNDEGKVLNMRTFQKKDNESVSILLRSGGGVGRFDERDAVTVVNSLIQLLRDESAAFSAIGNKFISNEMKQLQQIINRLEQGTFSSQSRREQTPYLVIRNNPKNPWQNVFIRYWSTAGLDANQVTAGSNLLEYKGSILENGRAILVNTTMGGHNKLGAADSVRAFKSALLSRDRLITQEDIKAFCHYQLGEKVTRIDIEKGVDISPDGKKGFVKTIDIQIEIRKKDYEKMSENGEIAFWTEKLKLLLEEKSVALFPYRIFINQAI